VTVDTLECSKKGEQGVSGTNRREVLFVLNRASPSAAASDTL